jgi:hypothetical protein
MYEGLPIATQEFHHKRVTRLEAAEYGGLSVSLAVIDIAYVLGQLYDWPDKRKEGMMPIRRIVQHANATCSPKK